MKQLGRLIPTDWEHYERYPLTATTTPAGPTPVAIGVNWYTNFDQPVQETGSTRWWVGRGDLGSVRGGHCVALAPGKLSDLQSWWEFYDQGSEGACVGFGCSRMMSLLNRKKYDGQWLYHKAKMVDEWPGESYEGTSVRAALSVLKDFGHLPWRKDKVMDVSPAEGIREYRGAKSVDEVHQVLQNGVGDRLGAVGVLNSWGRDGYPHVVWLPDAALDRLIREDGEVGLVVDR
jgi:hypothetical protein